MLFTFSTVYMTVLISNLLLILMILYFRNTKLLINAGYHFLAFFVLFIFLRLLIPFEFSFTTTVILPKWISKPITVMRHPLFTLGDTHISPWTFVLITWAVGIAVHLIKYIRLNREIKQQIFSNAKDVTSGKPYASLLESICRERKRPNNFRVLTIPDISTPMLYGIRRPCILIPQNLILSEQDLYYTLLHEASHHFYHDLMTKQIVKLITIFYWWNPLCYILNHHVSTVLEMRIDHKATSSNKATILAYLKCLLTLAEQSSSQHSHLGLSTMHLLPEHKSVLTLRFEMLTHRKKAKFFPVTLGLLTFFAAAYIGSYLVTFEASYVSPHVLDDTISQTTENTWAIKKADGTYDVYYTHVFIENTASLEYYISDIPIYTEGEKNPLDE